VIVRISATVHQEARDSDGIVTSRGRWEATVAKVEQGRPLFLTLWNITPSQRTSGLGRSLRSFLQDAFDQFQVTAYDRSVDAVEGDFGRVREDPESGSTPSGVGPRSTRKYRVRASVLQKQVCQFGLPATFEGAGFELSFEGCPALQAAFQRERSLDIP